MRKKVELTLFSKKSESFALFCVFLYPLSLSLSLYFFSRGGEREGSFAL